MDVQATGQIMLGRRGLLAWGGRLAGAGAVGAFLPGMAWAQAAEKYPTIKAEFESYVSSGKLPGVLATIGRASGMPDVIAVGTQGLGEKTPVNIDTLWRVYSMTKPITGMAAMILVGEGKMKLDQPISEFLPEFANMQILVGYDTLAHKFITRPAKNKILMKHVFTHTSGIAYPPFSNLGREGYLSANVTIAFPKANTKLTLADIAQTTAKLPLVHEPGESWNYGMNLEVLGRVIEVLDGRTFADFLRQEIFAPLKMNRTFVGVPVEEWKNMSQVYTQNKSGKKSVYTDEVGKKLLGFSTEMTMDYYKNTNTPLAMGGTDIISNVDDYARFFQMLLNYGQLDGVQLLSKKTVEMIEKPLFDVATKDGVAMGVTGRSQFKAGVTVYVYPEEQAKFETISAGSYFWLGYFGTQFWIDRKEDMFSMVFMQLAPEPTGHNGKYRHLVWGSIAK